MSETQLATRTPGRETLRVWGMHLLCFMFPLLTLAFVASGPHEWYVALAFLIPIVGSVWYDKRAAGAYRQPAPDLRQLPFDLTLYALVALQFVNLFLLGRMYLTQDFWSADTFVSWMLVGVNSGYSGIVVAHELIHRREKHMRLLGRLLMCTVLYEHFSTEHVRGHHARVGTPEDPATARFGETFHQFLFRTQKQQFQSAWRIERQRLKLAGLSWYHPRHLRNHVLQGVGAELALWVAFGWLFGTAAFFVYLLQARNAQVLLEAVNYFEHWGLVRTGHKVRVVDSWDADSWFTLYSLVGLSRHADHHAHASRPYPQLRYFEETPKLPYGYFGMVVLAMMNNRKFIRLMTEELERRRLGPFALTADS